jgi:hypothetical protein
MMTQPVEASPFLLPAAVAADRTLSGIAKVVFAVIASSRGLDGLCTAKLDAICQAAGASDRAVRDAAKQLVEAGYLGRLHQPHRPSAWVVLSVGGNHRLQSAETADSSRRKLPTGPESTPPSVGGNCRLPAPKPAEDWPSWEDQSAESTAPRARASCLPSLPSEEILHGEIVDVGKGVRGKPEPRPRLERTPCPPDFTPSPRTLAAVGKRFPDKDPSYELAKFLAYFCEGKGSRERRPGWDVSFLAWMERADPTPASVAAAPGGARAADAAARLSPSSRRLLEIIDEEERRHG